MIQFGKTYFYSKESKIVIPILVQEDKIICADKAGNTVIVLNQNYLTPLAKSPKGMLVPNFTKPVKTIVKPTVITKDTAAAEKTSNTIPDTSAVTTPASIEPTPKATEPIIVPVITRNDEPELAITKSVIIPPADTSILRRKAKVIIEEDYI